MVARTGSHYHPYRLEEQRDKVVLPEPRDQAHPVEARTMVGLPYRGWRYSEDIATVREVTRGRKTGCGKGEITLVSPLHSTFILTPVPPIGWTQKEKCYYGRWGYILHSQPSIPPWCRAKSKKWIWRQSQDWYQGLVQGPYRKGFPLEDSAIVGGHCLTFSSKF